MSYKLLQLNAWCGRQFAKIQDYLQKNEFNFATFQELAGGRRSETGGDIASQLEHSVQGQYKIIQRPVYNYIGDKESFLANGVLHAAEYTIEKVDVIRMVAEREIDPDDKDLNSRPYQATAITVRLGEKLLTIISGHFTWNSRPYDTDDTITRARKVYDYVKALSNPWILAGDFNVSAETLTVSQFDDLGINLTKVLRVSNTLNPRLHRAQHLFPKGIACDQVIVSRDLEVLSFGVEHVADLSDHLGLLLEFDFREMTITVG